MTIYPTLDEPTFAAAAQLQIDSDERIEHTPNSGVRSTLSDGAWEPVDDTGLGLVMFLIFTAAVLIVTGAVALLALVNSWWVLGVAFAVYIAMTTVVMLTVVHALSSRTRPMPERQRLSDMTLSPASVALYEGAAVSDSRRNAQRSRLPAEVDPMRPRVLMVTDENLAQANEIPELIRPLVEQAEVYVVAPTLTTRLQSLTGDIDPARASAQERLRTVFDHMHADGLEPRGVVGDEDQVTAIADALADFDADLMVLRLHAQGSESENWREHRLAKRVRSQFDLPTTAFFFDGQGHVVGHEQG